MTQDVRARVFTFDLDKRWACTGTRKGPGRGAGNICGMALARSLTDPIGLMCIEPSCDRVGFVIEHPDLRSCEVLAEPLKETHDGSTRKSAQ
jgi:hypothetical protein